MDCPYIPELGYSEFGKRLIERLGDRRYPLSGSIELTFRCSARCAHCYVACGHDGLPGRKELDTQEWFDLLDQVADAGCLVLLLTGGEPLIRSDFAEIYRGVKRRGMLPTLFTNGTLIDERIADLLAEWRPREVEITLYGHTAETYERVTQAPGSWARCRRGIELLVERNVPLTLKTCVMTINRHELADMRAYAEGLGLRFRYDPILNAGVDGNGSPKQYRLSPQEVVEIEAADPERAAAWRDLGERMRGVRPDPRYLYSCSAGQRSFHIDPYGRLSPCMMARAQEYDLRSGSFQEGWEAFLPAALSVRADPDFPCNHCDWISLCQQCPGWSRMEHGTLDEPVEYLCQIAHLRATAFGLDS